jgi:hypothetical protein
MTIFTTALAGAMRRLGRSIGYGRTKRYDDFGPSPAAAAVRVSHALESRHRTGAAGGFPEVAEGAD